MAKEKSKADRKAAPQPTFVKRAAKTRGKKQPRRWAQKLEGRILNTNRRINHDDRGKPFPADKLGQVTNDL